MKTEDSCKLEMNGQLDAEGLSSLRLLYAPLIGEEAVSLYQLLAVLAVSRRPITNHRLIVQLANMSIERFEQQRQILERHLLLKTFLDPKTNQYLYHILPVKSGNAFLRHEVFGRLYLRRMGKDAYEFAKLYFAEEHTDTKSYVELTASFSPDDPQWLQSSSDAFIRLRPSATQRAHPADGFDYERFLQGFERRFPPQLQTKEHLELIGELAQAHGIDALEMRKLVNQCINPRTKEFNVELLKKKARAKGRIIDDVPKDPYQASPVQFFRQLQPGIPISAADSRLIESLLVDYHLPKEVVNVLIEHVLARTDQSFPRSYVEKVASSWARLGIDTLEKAKAQAEKERSDKAYVPRQKTLPKWYGEVEDADVPEVDDQTIEQLQQRLGRQTE